MITEDMINIRFVEDDRDFWRIKAIGEIKCSAEAFISEFFYDKDDDAVSAVKKELLRNIYKEKDEEILKLKQEIQYLKGVTGLDFY